LIQLAVEAEIIVRLLASCTMRQALSPDRANTRRHRSGEHVEEKTVKRGAGSVAQGQAKFVASLFSIDAWRRSLEKLLASN
jgi:hypothetical protein